MESVKDARALHRLPVPPVRPADRSQEAAEPLYRRAALL